MERKTELVAEWQRIPLNQSLISRNRPVPFNNCVSFQEMALQRSFQTEKKRLMFGTIYTPVSSESGGQSVEVSRC